MSELWLLIELVAIGFVLGVLCVLAWLADHIDKDPHYHHVRKGKASFYVGSGMVAASRFYAKGQWVKVRYGNREIKVQITSAGPAWRFVRIPQWWNRRIIDLSRYAFMWLEEPRIGVIPVTVETCEPP